MATFDYAQSILDANELIAEFGATVTLRRSTNTGPAWDPQVSNVDHSAVMAVVAYSDNAIDGTNIRATDRQGLMSVGSLIIEPTIADKVIVDGKEMEIVNVDPLDPAGTVVMWTLQLRA